MEHSRAKKTRRYFNHGVETKALGNMNGMEPSVTGVKDEEAESDSPNKVSSPKNEISMLEDEDVRWPDSLSEAELDLLVSIKKLAVERSVSIGEECLQEILPASVLQTIGILMKELVKDHVRKLVCAHNSSQANEASSQDLTEDSAREV